MKRRKTETSILQVRGSTGNSPCLMGESIPVMLLWAALLLGRDEGGGNHQFQNRHLAAMHRRARLELGMAGPSLSTFQQTGRCYALQGCAGELWLGEKKLVFHFRFLFIFHPPHTAPKAALVNVLRASPSCPRRCLENPNGKGQCHERDLGAFF